MNIARIFAPGILLATAFPAWYQSNGPVTLAIGDAVQQFGTGGGSSLLSFPVTIRAARPGQPAITRTITVRR